MILVPGIELARKAVGETSFSLVKQRQDELRANGETPLPICHGGALDPFAEGLLLILIGPATRLMEELHPIPKYYEAEITWGRETDTGDAGGRVVFEGDSTRLTPESIEEIARALLGWQEQVPPATSNKRVDGERAYRRAHRGEEISLPPSRVYLHELKFTAHELPRKSRLSICCRGGYYVRSLARDLGRALSCGAHLTALRRTQIGPWSCPPAEGELSNLSKLPNSIITGEELLPWLPARRLSELEAASIELRRAIPRGEILSAPFSLPPDFPGPGAAKGDRPAPLRGLCDGKLRVLLRERGSELLLHTDLGGGL